MDAKDRIAQVS